MAPFVASCLLAAAPVLTLPIEKLEELSCPPMEASAGAALLPKARTPLPEDTSIDYGACGKVKLPSGLEGSLLRVHTALPMAEQTELVLVAVKTGGKPACSVTLSAASGSEVGSYTPSSRLLADLTLEQSVIGNYPVQDIEGLSEVVTTRTTRSALRMPGCKLETTSTAVSDLNGVFTDEKSHEMLLITGNRVFYRASAEKKAQELKVARLDAKSAAVQFGKSPKTYELKLEGESLSCKNPDGTLQTFKRTF